MASLSKQILPILKKAQKEPVKIACIGARKISSDEAELCSRIGQFFVSHFCFVGSGNAEGADQAYLRGVNKIAPWRGVLYLPWQDFNASAIAPQNLIRCEPYPEEYRNIVRSLHAKPAALNGKTWKLMIRNCAILNRADLCIALPSPTTGGTRFGMAVAEEMKVPVLDITQEETKDALLYTMETWL